jgi:hypothetical protein
LNIIERTLAQVPRPEGFVSAYLVELSTGQVLAGLTASGREAGSAAGDAGEGARALAEVLTDSFRQLATVMAVHSTGEDLEDLVVTTSRQHHLVKLLPELGGSDAFVLLTLDRATANLALARHLLLRVEADLVP